LSEAVRRRYGRNGTEAGHAVVVHTKAWSSKQASTQTYTYKQSVSSNQASKRTTNATLQYCCTAAVGRYKARHGRPSVCMHTASQCPQPALHCTDRCRPVSAAGRRFITGTAARIPLRISLQRRIFCLWLRRQETFARFHAEADLEKESRSQISAPTAACGVCVCVCVRASRPRFTEKLIARRAPLEIQRVTSPRLF